MAFRSKNPLDNFFFIQNAKKYLLPLATKVVYSHSQKINKSVSQHLKSSHHNSKGDIEVK